MHACKPRWTVSMRVETNVARLSKVSDAHFHNSLSINMSCLNDMDNYEVKIHVTCCDHTDSQDCGDTEDIPPCQATRGNADITIRGSIDCCRTTFRNCLDQVMPRLRRPTTTEVHPEELVSSTTTEDTTGNDSPEPRSTTSTTASTSTGRPTRITPPVTTPSTPKSTPSSGQMLSSTQETEANDQKRQARDDSSTGAVAGGVVGGLLGGVVITVLVVLVWWSCRRRRQRNQGADTRLGSDQPMTKTHPVVIPDVIMMSSSAHKEEGNDYQTIQKSQTRQPGARDYVDIREDDMGSGESDYHLAGGFNGISNGRQNRNNVTNGDDYNRIGDTIGPERDLAGDYFVLEENGKTDYHLAGGSNGISNGCQKSAEVNNGDDYNRLGDGNMSRPRQGANYDKIGETVGPGRDLAGDYFVLEEQRGIGETDGPRRDLDGDYFVLEEQGEPEQYNKLGATATNVSGGDAYNRLGQLGTDAKDDTQDEYNRLGGNKSDMTLGDVYNRLGQEDEEHYNRLGDKASTVGAGDPYNRLG